MRLADTSCQKLESFFQEYFNNQSFRLPQINIHAGRFSRFIASILKIDGITFGQHIFITPKYLERNSRNHLKIPEDLVTHEITHALQYRREGFIRFLYKYHQCYRQNLRKKEKWDSQARFEAYFEIPFEIEARETAEMFRVWIRS